MLFLPKIIKMESNIQFKILSKSIEMKDCYESIKQLNPSLCREDYDKLLSEMVNNQYKQLIAIRYNTI
jgi:hypothetical protein